MPRHASEQAAELIRMEYVQLPGLKLTFWQAQRLWNLPEDLCRQALAALTQSRFLARTADGAYVRAGWSHHRPEFGKPSDVLSSPRESPVKGGRVCGY